MSSPASPPIAIPDRLAKYVEYIRNTGSRSLRIDFFDDDWEPIGPTIRRDMLAAGLIVESDGGLSLADGVVP